MPDTITHILFAEKCLIDLDPNIDKQAFYLGSVGPDPLYYYKLLSLSDKSLSLRTARKIHSSTGDVFINKGCEYIDKIKDPDKIKVLKSYLYGFLAHYVLDSFSHPYINTVSAKYTYGHKRFEMKIDTLMLEKIKGYSSRKFDFNSYFKIDSMKLNSIASLFSYVVNEVYFEVFDPQIYVKGINDIRITSNLFKDPLRIFSSTAKFIEFITNKNDSYRYFFYSSVKGNEPDYLNTELILYGKTFLEIFESAAGYYSTLSDLCGSQFDFDTDFNGIRMEDKDEKAEYNTDKL